MRLHKVRLALHPGMDKRNRVELDGHDITHAVREVRVTHGVDQVPTVEVELLTPELQVYGEMEPYVQLSDEARKALVVLGWTPPEGE